MPPRIPREPEEQAKEGAKRQRHNAWWYIVGAVLALFIPGGLAASIVLVVVAVIVWRTSK
jgi:hypothetical protein